jgi:hypothetical protein
MLKKLNRKDKIRLLNGLKEGSISIISLNSPQVYFFVQTSRNKNVYKLDDREINQLEYKLLFNEIMAKNDKSIIWNELKTY